ncbi:MAG: FKBP-type peptidyl-prolyl cis-trans isomerase [Chitinophagales bacterium]
MNYLKKLTLLLIPFVIFACKKSDVDQAKVDREIIRKYIADSSLVADSTASGLFYVIADSGIGANPVSTSSVLVYYKGYFTDGTIFDQNPAGLPKTFLLNGVIPGWTEGVPKIRKGGKIKLLIPSALGYGSNGYGGVPGNTVLIFDIELVNFQ